MVRNYLSNDIGLVQPTKYPISKGRIEKASMRAISKYDKAIARESGL